jgi:hypothetical protein
MRPTVREKGGERVAGGGKKCSDCESVSFHMIKRWITFTIKTCNASGTVLN